MTKLLVGMFACVQSVRQCVCYVLCLHVKIHPMCKASVAIVLLLTNV